MKESFKPISHTPPNSFLNKIKFHIRLILDFQVLTVYTHLKRFIKNKRGTVLDIGCGECPYVHLFKDNFEYIGIDYFGSDLFGYKNSNVIKFDGVHIPFSDNSVDYIICTEVLEHTQQTQELIQQMHRVLKHNGKGFITTPWSTRFHYIPYDYYRFTPSALKTLFQDFSKIELTNRGTDITVIVSKIVVVFVRSLTPDSFRQSISFLLAILLLPTLLVIVPIGHLSILFNLGSVNDPLGYSIEVTK